MGNQMRKDLPEKDFEYLEKHTDFRKPDIMEFYKEFMKINPDGNMKLEAFQDFLKGCYKENSSEFAERYFHAADKDKSGKINFKEFLLFLNHECTSDPVEKLNWVFDLFDIDGNGTIERPEMIKIYKTVKDLRKKRSKYDPTPGQIADKMFEICDKNVDDKLTKVEFITTFMEDPVLFAIFCGNMTEDDEEDT
ncbi:neuronal calcium sensor 2-like [Mytilus californianus]|uniref:neuronal calcium sensor 2-like n=1 Tax=Mytilus californianus TaxID=6549 RepID=UPI00224510D7|nr:neuronal calcium sensor 2-like [Mytilus californianus]